MASLGPCLVAAVAKSEMLSTALREIDPSRLMPMSRRSEMITLASSRARSHMTRSPGGRTEAFSTRITSIAEAEAQKQA